MSSLANLLFAIMNVTPDKRYFLSLILNKLTHLAINDQITCWLCLLAATDRLIVEAVFSIYLKKSVQPILINMYQSKRILQIAYKFTGFKLTLYVFNFRQKYNDIVHVLLFPQVLPCQRYEH